jgi:uncharacterized membrane protein
MIRPILIGLVTGLRSFPPVALVSLAMNQGRLPAGGGAVGRLGRRAMVSGTAALAAAELAGDKMKWAPDRTIAPGLLVRAITGALSGAGVTRPGDHRAGAVAGAVAAVIGGYLGLAVRRRAQARYGQTRSGVAEDAIAVALALLLVGGASRRLPVR